MRRISVILTLFFTLVCYSQIPEDFPLIGKADIPDAEFTAPRHFTGESLYGYMNGGAELYREYGISDAVITEFDLIGGHYKCEVFKMKGPQEAFGVFSVSKFRCSVIPDIADFACQSRYQLQICKGSYYISIINRNGTRADSMILLETGKIVAGKIKESSVNLKNFLPETEQVDFRQNTVLVKGKLGLMNGASRWEDYFKDVSGFSALIVNLKDKTLISARFDNADDFSQFIGLHGWGTCDLSVIGLKMKGGETITLLADTHLLIEISE